MEFNFNVLMTFASSYGFTKLRHILSAMPPLGVVTVSSTFYSVEWQLWDSVSYEKEKKRHLQSEQRGRHRNSRCILSGGVCQLSSMEVSSIATNVWETWLCVIAPTWQSVSQLRLKSTCSNTYLCDFYYHNVCTFFPFKVQNAPL